MLPWLMDQEDPATLKALSDALKDADESVRVDAAIVIRHSDQSEVPDAMLDALKDPTK
jgi:HEAT repeat protein